MSLSVSWQFVTEGSDQSGLVKPVVEYCVVCGDKASGRMFASLFCDNVHQPSVGNLKSLLLQDATTAPSAVRAVRASSSAASERT